MQRIGVLEEGAVMTMSAPHPHSTVDLALAPVLISIERNLEQYRDSYDLAFDLALQLNDDASWYSDAAGRARRVRDAATRGVDLHGWRVQPSEDRYGLVVEHGGYHVTVALGKQLTDYVEDGTLELRRRLA
jgi:hypothetical protein